MPAADVRPRPWASSAWATPKSPSRSSSRRRPASSTATSLEVKRSADHSIRATAASPSAASCRRTSASASLKRPDTAVSASRPTSGTTVDTSLDSAVGVPSGELRRDDPRVGFTVAEHVGPPEHADGVDRRRPRRCSQAPEA